MVSKKVLKVAKEKLCTRLKEIAEIMEAGNTAEEYARCFPSSTYMPRQNPYQVLLLIRLALDESIPDHWCE